MRDCRGHSIGVVRYVVKYVGRSLLHLEVDVLLYSLATTIVESMMADWTGQSYPGGGTCSQLTEAGHVVVR